jgi:hypothetical protein
VKRILITIVLWLGLAGESIAEPIQTKGNSMAAKGSFEINLTPQDDGDHPAGRLLIDKSYSGDLQGTGTGQMISKRTEGGPAAYYAVEDFAGSVGGKGGSITLVHSGYMNAETRSLDVSILSGSGSGELEGISGTMQINQEDGGHQYILDYQW